MKVWWRKGIPSVGLVVMAVATVVLMVGSSTAVAGYIGEGTPLVSDVTSHKGSLGCAGSDSWNIGGISLTTGTGGMYSHLHEINFKLGCTPPPGADTGLNNGAKLTRFEWNHASGTYNVSVVWTISARLAINATLAVGCGRGALATQFNVLDEQTGGNLWSSDPSNAIFNSTFCGTGGSGHYSNTFYNTYNFTYAGGISLARGVFYDPFSYTHLWTYVSGGADVLVDCQSSGYYVTVDSFNVW
ncbi:MAG: hypothetical protein L3K18_00005 [Thermoplasmata archaeon]|nr:hypothetical protein [Thermoplasmata archaeon]